MYINFEQNRASRLVKPVRTNIFAKNWNYTNNIFLNRLFHCRHEPSLLQPLYRVCNITVIIICKYVYRFTTLNRGAS